MKRQFMYLVAVFTVLFVVMLAGPAAWAQNAVRVSIPFAFSANHQVLPAGTYRVELQAENYIMFINCQTGKVAGLLVRSTGSSEKIGHGSLVFWVSPSRNQLVQIKFANTNTQSDLAAPTSLEREREMATGTVVRTVEIATR